MYNSVQNAHVNRLYHISFSDFEFASFSHKMNLIYIKHFTGLSSNTLHKGLLNSLFLTGNKPHVKPS